MNRNQKIGLGCGVAGCLGLIVIVVIVIVLVGMGILALPGLGSPNSNANSNANSSSNTSDTNANDNSNSNQNSDFNSSSSTSGMSNDDKHKLMQAAGVTKDSELIQRVLRKLGFVTDSGVSDDYPQFIQDHKTWAMRSIQFIRSVNTPETARAYVDAHIND